MPANKQKAAHRASLETISVSVAVIKDLVALIELRVKQVRDRTGLSDLLSPALDEITEVTECLSEIAKQVAHLMRE